MKKGFSEAEKRIKEQGKNIDALAISTQNQFVKIEKRFDGIDKRFDGVDGRMDGLENKIENIEINHGARFNQIDEKLVKHDAKSERLFTAVDDLGGRVDHNNVESAAGYKLWSRHEERLIKLEQQGA